MNRYLSQPSENALPKKQVRKHISKPSHVFGCIWFMGQLTDSAPPLNLQGISLNTLMEEKITMYGVEQGTSLSRASHGQEFLKELKNVCETEYSQDNWDGYGARAISKQACNDAERFVQMLPDSVRMLPDISPMPAGDIALEWYGGDKKVFHVTFHGDSAIEYIGAFGGQDKVAARETFKDRIPESVLHYIGRIIAAAT